MYSNLFSKLIDELKQHSLIHHYYQEREGFLTKKVVFSSRHLILPEEEVGHDFTIIAIPATLRLQYSVSCHAHAQNYWTFFPLSEKIS